MKTFIPYLRTGSTRLMLAVALCLGADFVAAAEKKPDEKETSKKATTDLTKTSPITIVFPKSSFATVPEVGQDPFFPGSKRRLPKVPEPPKPKLVPPTNTLLVPHATTPDVKPVVAVVPPDPIGSANLTLRGISGTKARRVAVVHTGARSYDFQQGDSTLIRLPNEKQIKVRCVDVRERSAVFESEGQTKELFLRERVF